MKPLYTTLLATLLISCGSLRKGKYTEPTTNRLVQLSTVYGTVEILLSDSTPLHRNNFVQLVKEHYYDSLLFHRVIQNFMVQGGDPNSKYAKAGTQLGEGGKPYTVPAEFNKQLFHKKGALAAARDNNAAKASSSTQFYIVQGRQYTNAGLDSVERYRMQGRKLSDSARYYYKTIGGAPHLDGNYTVYGMVTKGLYVIDSIAAQMKDGNNRPIKDIRMQMRMLH